MRAGPGPLTHSYPPASGGRCQVSLPWSQTRRPPFPVAFFILPTSRQGYGFYQRVALTWEPVRPSFHLLLKGGPIGLQLRASNEGLRRPRVTRGKETNGLPLPSTPGGVRGRTAR